MTEDNVQLEDVQFIMVSHYTWSEKKRSLYQVGFIDELVFALLEDSVPTLFICIPNNKGTIESWTGRCRYFKWGVNNFGNERNIQFKITDLKTSDTPQEFTEYKVGWYVNKPNYPMTHLPHYLSKIQKTNDWWLFEKYCHYLLKLIDVNNIEPVPLHKSNRGKPDGYFITNDLFVWYDATCQNEFMKVKKDQLADYIAKVEELLTFTIAGKPFDLTGMKKQIWIITQRNQKYGTLYTSDLLIAKEVPIQMLIDIYKKRQCEDMNEDYLCELLKNIG